MGEDQTDKYIYTKMEIKRTNIYTKGEIRRTNIYTKMEIRRTNIYTIRLNSMTPLKQRGKIRWRNKYTKAGDQTDKYIY